MRLSVSSKVFLGFAAVICTFGAVTLFGVREMHGIGQGLALVSQAYHPLTRLSAQLESSFRESEQATGRLRNEDDVRTRRALLAVALDSPVRAAREKVRAARELVWNARGLAPGRMEASFLDRVDGLLAATLLRYDEYARAGAEADALLGRLAQAPDDDVREQLDAALRKLKKVEAGIAGGLADLSGEMEARIDWRVRQAGIDERRAAFLIVAFSLGAILIGLLVTAASQRALAPIRRLTEAVKAVGEGRFAGEVAVAADDEMGVLAREFNAMARNLAERGRQLAEKNAELLRSERLAAVGRLAAQITHEIRNPLSSLSLNAELLQEQLAGALDAPAGRDEARALVSAMAREVDRLVGITEEYLRFARLPKPSLERVDLADAVEDLLDFMAPELAASGVEVRRDLAADAPAVRADAAQVRQVLLNLVRNAREATGPGGHVSVRTWLLDGAAGHAMVAVEIEDDGPGIAPEVQARIFEPFFSTKERGTGLGLALVQQIVHEHGGHLSCDSAPGRGTRLQATFPVFADAPGAQPADAAARAG